MSASAATAVLCGSATWCRAVGTVPALRQTKLTEGLAPAQLVPRVALTGHFNTLGAHQRPHWVVRPWRALLCLPASPTGHVRGCSTQLTQWPKMFFFPVPKNRKAKSEASVGDGAASSGACGHPSAWPMLRRLPWPRRFLAKAIRGPEPGAQVLEPLHLTRILGPPPDL